MIPNEVLAAWIVAATTGAAALGVLSLLDGHSSRSGVEAEPLPFYYPDLNTASRLSADNAWRSHLEATGSLPARPAATPADWDDDEVDEMDRKDGKDELSADPFGTVYDPNVFLGP